MKSVSFVLALLGAVAATTLVSADPAQAGGRKSQATSQEAGEHPKSRYYHRKKGTRVYGYATRRGGYSYYPQDVVNTYGLSRSQFGSINSYRNPWTDRQSQGGPFDHGFFFDSGMGPQGGNSLYLH